MEKFDVAVIGAGISGAATAYTLAKAGASVAVIDRFGPAAMASGWTLAGVRQSGRDPAELPLAMEAIEIWQTLHQELGAPTHYRRKGNLRLARNAEEYEQIRTMVRGQRELGLDLTFLASNDDVRAIAPAVSPTILGASFCASDGHADPQATSAAYMGMLDRLGVTRIMAEAVEAIEVSGGKVCGVRTVERRIAADGVVLVAGVMGNELLKPLGVRVPIETPMVAVIRSVPIPPVLEQVIGVSGGDWAGRQEASGRLRITSGALPWGGAMEIMETAAGARPVIRPPLSSLREIIEKLAFLLPGLDATPIEECWAGLLDLTPDAVPVLDHVPGVEGLVVGMGFSGHGFCLGPVTGKILADLVSGRSPLHDLSAFRSDRFSTTPAAGRLELHG
ncbi:FAD-binding oxidoreductase [Rhizobium sp. P40RR-XXII]|uniref:NAD(P)/FAD-dependent oxidoreductase n=1 Tax=unclassified Rhizobium TaxID=2613769 RepID=UPI00145748DD|nr:MULTISPECIES: FAD-binding oxidoreductase [unclassified Rhizobium]NLR85421.1 FAD-binding oxidoreductase [Rhizobium sp. P28RR-XV]NLS20079.1 FAD-binding oxidoreductase [Rhizobium sp. P40RR-XXII]